MSDHLTWYINYYTFQLSLPASGDPRSVTNSAKRTRTIHRPLVQRSLHSMEMNPYRTVPLFVLVSSSSSSSMGIYFPTIFLRSHYTVCLVEQVNWVKNKFSTHSCGTIWIHWGNVCVFVCVGGCMILPLFSFLFMSLSLKYHQHYFCFSVALVWN